MVKPTASVWARVLLAKIMTSDTWAAFSQLPIQKAFVPLSTRATNRQAVREEAEEEVLDGQCEGRVQRREGKVVEFIRMIGVGLSSSAVSWRASSLPHKGTLWFENLTQLPKHSVNGLGCISDEVALEQSSGHPRTTSAFIQLISPPNCPWVSCGVGGGEGGCGGGRRGGMTDKTFISCLTFGWTPENPTQDREFNRL